MARITQAEFARRRGINRVSVWQRTTTNGGPIPVYGPRKLIDVDEANALWEATMSAQGAARAKAPPPAPAEGAPVLAAVSGTQLAQARAAALVVDVQTKRLNLEQRRGSLISRERAQHKAFSFARTVRDACQTWPARIGPQMAAAFDLDAGAVTVYLEEHVRTLLAELASERVEF